MEKRGIEQIERIDKIEQIEEIEQIERIDEIEQIDFIVFVFYLLYFIYLLYSLFFYLLKKLFFPKSFLSLCQLSSHVQICLGGFFAKFLIFCLPLGIGFF